MKIHNMNYFQEIIKLFHLEKSYTDIVKVLKLFPTSEEIPLISRVDHLLPFHNLVKREDLNSFFLNLAVSYLNILNLISPYYLDKNEIKDFYACITYPDIEDLSNPIFGFNVPYIFITQRRFLPSFERLNKLDMEHHKWLERALDDLNLRFSCSITYEYLSDGLDGNIFRIYILFPNHEI